MIPSFIVQFHDNERGEYLLAFDSSHLGGLLPEVGDIVISPESRRDFRSGDPAKHFAFEVTQRYLLPDVTVPDSPALMKFLVTRRPLSALEATLVPPTRAI